jgi:hypothetical protein
VQSLKTLRAASRSVTVRDERNTFETSETVRPSRWWRVDCCTSPHPTPQLAGFGGTMLRPCALAGAAALVGLLASSSQATPIYGSMIATGGDVVVTFDSNDAAYTSELFLDGAYGDELGVLFNNKTTAVGTSMNLGSFAAGTELVFKLIVNETGDVFYTGAESRNADSLAHAMVYGGEEQVLIGFEDVLGGGDFDYNDLMFSFTNVAGDDTVAGGGTGATTGSASTAAGAGAGAAGGSGGVAVAAVDEPSTLVLLGGGLSLLVVVMRRKQSAAGSRDLKPEA